MKEYEFNKLEQAYSECRFTGESFIYYGEDRVCSTILYFGKNGDEEEVYVGESTLLNRSGDLSVNKKVKNAIEAVVKLANDHNLVFAHWPLCSPQIEMTMGGLLQYLYKQMPDVKHRIIED